MTDVTLDDLKDFTQNEKRMVEDLVSRTGTDEQMEPSEESIRNILAFSLALSVRKTAKLPLRLVLN